MQFRTYSSTHAFNRTPNPYQVLAHLSLVAISIIYFIALAPNLISRHA